MRREYTIPLVDLEPRTVESRLEAKEKLRQVPLFDEEHNNYVGTTIVVAKAELIHRVLKKNVDLFALTTSYMSGVIPDIITHKLLVYKEAIPVAEKKRKLSEGKRLAAKEEGEKLLLVGFIREA